MQLVCRVDGARSTPAAMASRIFLRMAPDSRRTSSKCADGKGLMTILAGIAKIGSRAVSRQSSAIRPFDAIKPMFNS